MKKRFLSLFALCLVCLLGVTSNAWGTVKTYQHVFTTKPSIGTTTTLSNMSWSISATNLGSYNSGNYAGVQFGTSKASGSITLTSSSAWSYQSATEIKEVRLWLNKGGGTVTPTVTIGGVSATSDGAEVVKNSSAGNQWTNTTKVTFTPATTGKTGVIVVNVSSTAAGYICCLEIDCDEAGPSTDASATFKLNGDGISFTDNAYTKNVAWDDATETYSVAVTTASKATVSSVTGATGSSSPYTIAAPSDGNTATATFTITAEDGTTTNTYTINIVKAAAPTATYTVTFNAGSNGTCATAYLTEANPGEGITLPSATGNTGYVFLGWSTNSEASVPDDGLVSGATYKPSANCNLYAVYAPLYSVTLKDTDPATVLTQSVVGGTVNLPSRSCVNLAYSFAGWSETNVSSETATAPTLIPAGGYTPTANIELYPVFKKVVGSGNFTWDVVTDASQLAADDVVIIASGNKALGAQSGNNCPATGITVSGNQITAVGSALQLTLETGSVANSFAFNTGNGYLYAASSESNYLKIQENIDGNASFTISISNKLATITAQGTNTCKILKYNSSSSLFSCYASGQTNPNIYKKNEERTTYYTSNPPAESLQVPIITKTTGEYWGAITVEITQSQGRDIYYSTNGNDPKTDGTLYENPISVTESCTVKAVAKDGNEYSGIVSAEFTIIPTTANVPVSEAFTSAPTNWRKVGSWTFNSYGAVAEGTAEAWLISPQIIKTKDTYTISYESASKEGVSGELGLYYSTDYDPSTNNYASASWTKIEDCHNVSGAWTWTTSTPTLNSDNVYFAFKYSSDNGNKWEFKNLSINEKYGSQETGTASFETTNIFVEKTKTGSNTTLTTNSTQTERSYESDNTAVATVNATTGVVTAVSEGVATITVTIPENAGYTQCTASYTVTVTPEGNWWYEDWTGCTTSTVLADYNARYTAEGASIKNDTYAGGVAPELMLNGTWTIDLSADVLDGVYTLQYNSNGNPTITVTGGAVGNITNSTVESSAKKYDAQIVVNDADNFSITFTTGSNTRLDNIALIAEHDIQSYEKTISTRKMATMYLPYAVEIPTGVKAYIAEENGKDAIKLTKITDGIIPAETGVIVYADITSSQSFTFTETVSAKTYSYTNCLNGVAVKTAYNEVAGYDASSYNYYALMAKGETDVEFRKVSSGSYAANSAYLVLPQSSGVKVSFSFDDDATGIQLINGNDSDNDCIYNLNGMKVDANYKGIVIKNGKKYINK